LGLTTVCFASVSAAAFADGGGASAAAPQPSPTAPAPDESAGGAAAGVVPFMEHPTIAGDVGVIKHGIAYAPANAPLAVQQVIWAANSIVGKPYIFGGGHKSFHSRGYDCSGTVSFALHGGDLLTTPMDSSDFMHWGLRGKGAWITVYTNPGHAWAMIAGMRLDTSGPGKSGPRWRTQKRSGHGFRARHPELY
jgi:hypothetical protein